MDNVWSLIGVVSGRMYRKSVIISKKIDIGSPPQKEGYLMKKSPAMFAGWQKRYFLTNGNGDIEYYLSVSPFLICYAVVLCIVF